MNLLVFNKSLVVWLNPKSGVHSLHRFCMLSLLYIEDGTWIYHCNSRSCLILPIWLSSFWVEMRKRERDILLFQVGRVFSGWVCFLRFCSFCLFCDIQAEHLPPWSRNHVKQKSKYYKGWKTVLNLFAVNFNPEQRPTEVGRLEPKWMMSEFKLPLFHSWVVLA
jgi:hypothetical protein